MGTTKDAIANLVLANLEISREITSVDTEQSAEASLIRRHYDRSLQKVLEDFPMAESTRYAVLGLVATAPTDDWGFAFRYPSDCVFARRLVTVLGREEPNPPPFKVGSDAQGLLLYTNINPATLEYTFLLTDQKLFSSAFEEALAWHIAAKCTSLSRMKDAKKIAMAMYQSCLTQSDLKTAREQQQQPELDSAMMRARI